MNAKNIATLITAGRDKTSNGESVKILETEVRRNGYKETTEGAIAFVEACRDALSEDAILYYQTIALDCFKEEASTWDRVVSLKPKDNRHKGLQNDLEDEEIECILGTIDYFGGSAAQAYSDLSANAKAKINGHITAFAPRYRVFDFIGMCVMGDRIGSTDATKVLAHSFLKSDGDVNKFIADLRTTDYDMDHSWEAIEL